MEYQRYQDIPFEVIQEVLSLVDKGLHNYEITDALGINNYYISRIREKNGRPKSQGNRNKTVYSEDQKNQMIDLLIEGHTSSEVSRITGINVQTLHAWRRKEIEKGNNLPIFEKPPTIPPPAKRKYTDKEMIELVALNPGFGLDRMLRVLYPKSKSINRIRYRITMLLKEYQDVFGQDLYELIQSPDYSTQVTEAEFLRITGKKYLPPGYGRSTGVKRKKKSAGGGKNKYIPLPPQDFNWGPYKLQD